MQLKMDISEIVSTIRAGDKIAMKYYLKKGGDPNARNNMGWTLLHLACLEGKAEIAEILLDEGASVNACTSDMNTPLHRACTQGNFSTVEVLINKGAYINAQDKYGNTPLHDAARALHTPVAKLLIDKKADRNRVNKKNQRFTDRIGQQLMPIIESGDIEVLIQWLEWGISPNTVGNLNWSILHHACARGHINIASLLLERGANVNSSDSNKGRPLHSASFYGHKRIVDLLIAKGADLNCQDQLGNTPLHSAIAGSHPDIINSLLENGCDTTIPNAEGQIFTHLVNEFLVDAVENKRIAHVRSLLKGRADPNTKDSTGYPVLCCAAFQEDLLTVDALLEVGADANVCSEVNLKSALHYASSWGNLFILKSLLDKGARVAAVDQEKKTPLHEAARGGAEDVVTVLIGRMAPLDAKDIEGNTPLHIAARWGQTGIVDLLIEKGARDDIKNNDGHVYMDLSLMRAVRTENCPQVLACLAWGGNPNVTDSKGWSLLHHAVYKVAADVVHLLIDSESEVNVFDKEGRTPLLLAAYRGHVEIMRELLDAGANANVQDKRGRTPLHWAAAEGSADVVDLLLERGAEKDIKNKEGQLYTDLLVKHLYLAVRHNDSDKVDRLLKAGANQTVRVRGTDITARDEAKRRKQYNILREMVAAAPKKKHPIKDDISIIEDISRLFEDHEHSCKDESEESSSTSSEESFDPDEDAYWRMHNAPVIIKAKELFEDENKDLWEHWDEKPKIISVDELFKEDEEDFWNYWKEHPIDSPPSSEEEEKENSVDSKGSTFHLEDIKNSWGEVVPAKEFFREDECWWRDAVEELESPTIISAKEFFKEETNWWEDDEKEDRVISAKDFFQEDTDWWLDDKKDNIDAKEYFKDEKEWQKDDPEKISDSDDLKEDSKVEWCKNDFTKVKSDGNEEWWTKETTNIIPAKEAFREETEWWEQSSEENSSSGKANTEYYNFDLTHSNSGQWEEAVDNQIPTKPFNDIHYHFKCDKVERNADETDKIENTFTDEMQKNRIDENIDDCNIQKDISLSISIPGHNVDLNFDKNEEILICANLNKENILIEDKSKTSKECHDTPPENNIGIGERYGMKKEAKEVKNIPKDTGDTKDCVPGYSKRENEVAKEIRSETLKVEKEHDKYQECESENERSELIQVSEEESGKSEATEDYEANTLITNEREEHEDMKKETQNVQKERKESYISEEIKNVTELCGETKSLVKEMPATEFAFVLSKNLETNDPLKNTNSNNIREENTITSELYKPNEENLLLQTDTNVSKDDKKERLVNNRKKRKTRKKRDRSGEDRSKNKIKNYECEPDSKTENIHKQTEENAKSDVKNKENKKQLQREINNECLKNDYKNEILKEEIDNRENLKTTTIKPSIEKNMERKHMKHELEYSYSVTDKTVENGLLKKDEKELNKEIKRNEFGKALFNDGVDKDQEVIKEKSVFNHQNKILIENIPQSLTIPSEKLLVKHNSDKTNTIKLNPDLLGHSSINLSFEIGKSLSTNHDYKPNPMEETHKMKCIEHFIYPESKNSCKGDVKNAQNLEDKESYKVPSSKDGIVWTDNPLFTFDEKICKSNSENLETPAADSGSSNNIDKLEPSSKCNETSGLNSSLDFSIFCKPNNEIKDENTIELTCNLEDKQTTHLENRPSMEAECAKHKLNIFKLNVRVPEEMTSSSGNDYTFTKRLKSALGFGRKSKSSKDKNDSERKNSFSDSSSNRSLNSKEFDGMEANISKASTESSSNEASDNENIDMFDNLGRCSSCNLTNLSSSFGIVESSKPNDNLQNIQNTSSSEVLSSSPPFSMDECFWNWNTYSPKTLEEYDNLACLNISSLNKICAVAKDSSLSHSLSSTSLQPEDEEDNNEDESSSCIESSSNKTCVEKEVESSVCSNDKQIDNSFENINTNTAHSKVAELHPLYNTGMASGKDLQDIQMKTFQNEKHLPHSSADTLKDRTDNNMKVILFTCAIIFLVVFQSASLIANLLLS